MSNKDYYIFNEPHPTGGDSTVRISGERIVRWMKNSKNKKLLAVIDSLSEEEIIDEFCTIHYAWKEENPLTSPHKTVNIQI